MKMEHHGGKEHKKKEERRRSVWNLEFGVLKIDRANGRMEKTE